MTVSWQQIKSMLQEFGRRIVISNVKLSLKVLAGYLAQVSQLFLQNGVLCATHVNSLNLSSG